MIHKTSPAYQEYASALLSNRNYKQMSLAAKGLLHHIRLECWENGDVPSSPAKLSKIIGCEVSEVSSLINECMFLLKIVGETLISPDLEAYRERLLRNSSVRAEAGKKGGKNKANATNLLKQNSSKTLANATNLLKQNSSKTLANARDLPDNLLKQNPSKVNQYNPTQPHAVSGRNLTEGTLVDTQWVEEYNDA